MIRLTLISVLCLTAPVLAFAAPQSNTVPTSQLQAVFQVAPSVPGDAQVAALVILSQVTVSNGQVTTIALDQSSNDVFTFNVGATTITYDPANAASNALPYVAGATYSATFTRFNGEIYHSTAVMPQTTTITAPTLNEVFKKGDEVDMAWSAVGADEGLFLVESDCGSIDMSKLSYNSAYTAAVIPAGAASSCAGTVHMQFVPVYVNGGTGFGSFAAASEALALFSYGDTAGAWSPVPLAGIRLNQLLAEVKRTGNRTIVLRK